MTPKQFDSSMSEAAHVAAEATRFAMLEMASGRVYDEDDVTGALVGELNAALRSMIGSFKWQAKILRHRRGKAAEELKYGADLLLHVDTQTPGRSFKKGVLIQAKKVEPDALMSRAEHERLQGQCETMLSHTPASYIFDYAESGVRVSSANKVSGLADRHLHSNCEWTAYRFFYEFFRCPVGDRDVTTTHIGGKRIIGDTAPTVLQIEATGE